MHTIEMLDQALAVATRLGYSVRHEWFAGNGGGGCELRGRKLLFLDLDLSPADQLDQVLETLRHEPDAANLPMPDELHERLTSRLPV